MPYLLKNTSFVSIGIGGIVATATVFQILLEIDPWAKIWWVSKQPDFYLCSLPVLALITFYIAYKQWSYYYNEDERHLKKGIFVGAIRQVNPRERNMDILLSFIGGVFMISSVTLPTLWFFMTFLYSIFVIGRCFFTLRRKHYSKKLNYSVPDWYDDIFNREFKGLNVTSVLGGWIITHSLIGLFSFLSFIFLFLYFGYISKYQRFLFFLTSISIIGLLYLVLTKRSYEWGNYIAGRIQDS